MSKIKVKIIQPTRIVLDDECNHIIIPGMAGDFGVDLDHTPLIATIRPGPMTLFNDEQVKAYAIHDGFVTVENNVVRIVCEVIEEDEEIDKARAEKAQKRAKDRLATQDSDIDYRRAEAALSRAMARLQAIAKEL